MSGQLDKIARFTIEVTPKVAGVTGIQQLDKLMAAFEGANKKQVAQARLLADAQVREAQRATRAVLAEQAKLQRSNEQLARAQIRQDEAAASGRIGAYRRATLEIESLNRRIIASNQAVADRQDEAAAKQKAAQAAGIGLARAQRGAAISTGLGMVGTGLLGAGGVGLAAGGLSLKSAMNWQTFVARNVSNSPMTPPEQKAFQQLALQLATQTGANPEDVFLALRYGAEMGLSPAADKRFLTAALALGLPTGGSAAIAPSLMALATVRKNFGNQPFSNNPQAIGNMILAASQNSAGVSASDFVAAMPEIMGIAGHIGGSDQMQQALAAFAALTSAGMPLSVANTQMKNLLTKILKPSPAAQRWIASFDKANGTNLAGDFGYQALSTKGLAGIVSDIHGMGLNPTEIANLFPNMRGYIGALGLTGNQTNSFTKILGNINQAPSQNPMGADFNRYLGLDSTQAKILQQQLHVLAITVGTELLPPFNHLLKDTIVPGVKDLSAFVGQHKALISTLIQLSPYLIAMGGSLKIAMGLFKMYGEVRAFGTALGLIPKAGVSKELDAIAKANAADEITAASTAAGEGAPKFGALATSLKALAPEILAVAAAWQIYGDVQKNGADPSKWGRTLANYFLTSPIDPLLHKAGLPTLKDILGNLIPGLDKYVNGGSSQSGHFSSTASILGGVQTKSGPNAASLLLGNNGLYAPIVQQVAKQLDMPVSVVAALLNAETNGNPNPYQVSSAGAVGLTQIIPKYHPGTGDLTNPRNSIYQGANILLALYNGPAHHNWDLAYRMYNAGQGNPGGADPNAVARFDQTFVPVGSGSVLGANTPAAAYGIPSGSVYHPTGYLKGESSAYGFTAQNEVNYGLGSTSYPFYCPPGTWEVMRIVDQRKIGIGLVLIMQNVDTGQPIAFLHLRAIYVHVGDTVKGGKKLGMTGWPTSKQWSGPMAPGPSDAHLAVVYGSPGSTVNIPSGGNQYKDPAGGGTKTTFDPSQAQTVLDAIAKPYRNADSTIDFRRMPPSLRQEADTLIRLVAANNLNLGPIGNALNNAVGAGLITKAQGDQAYQTTAHLGAGAQNDPEKWYNQQHAKKAKTPAQWASYWNSKAGKDQKVLQEILGPYTDVNGNVNWSAMPPKVRAAADYYIRQLAGDKYMSTRGTLNADISNPAVRSALMGQAWSGGPTSYMAGYSNPEAYWNAVNGKTGTGGASAGAQAIHIIGKNCEAALHALHPQKETASNTKALVNHAAKTNELLGHLIDIVKGNVRPHGHGNGSVPRHNFIGTSHMHLPFT